MYKLSLTTLFILLSYFSFSQWTLVWSDEFTGTALDANKWSHETGGWGWGNNEAQYYTTNSTNLNVGNDLLTITALEETIGTNAYSSAKIVTKNKIEVKYGKIEARIKVPMGQGIWPAFWMLGSNIDAVSWPKCGEIDIMEHINNENKTHGTAHWDNGGHVYNGSSITHDPTQFHIYSVEWDAQKIQWFMDGTLYHTLNTANAINGTNEFHESFYLILNLAVGGNWPGYPNATTVFPSSLIVDYVRIYKDVAELGLEKDELSFIRVYPNPSKEVLHLEGLTEPSEILIRSIDGTLCMKASTTVTMKDLDISSLSSGTYFLEIQSAEGRVHRVKFVKN